MADGLMNEEFKQDRQIVVTDRMVEAGATALVMSGYRDEGPWVPVSADEAVKAVFEAMARESDLVA